MTKSNPKQLREYCNNANLRLERCNKPGFWIVMFDKRPNPQQFNEFRKAVLECGYQYHHDTMFNDGTYCITLNTK